ncbi:hypothetical protein BS78_08G127100 [Paspalum vaginatum]|nr:hypothetical protein BS78_08G127100 [Paspalum vaginatum]
MIEKGCESCMKWQEHYYWEHMDASKICFFRRMTGDFTRGLTIPKKFAKNFKWQTVRGIQLKLPSGETWHISVEKHDDELVLMSGWEDFVKDHELQENDLLLFKCCAKSSFEVVIFEASGCQKVSSLFGSRIGPRMCKQFNDVAGHHGEPESQNTSNFIVNHVANGAEDSDDEYDNSNYYYSRFARLTHDEKEEIVRLVSIGPNNPVFMTVLTNNHVQRSNNSLIIPCQFAADHLEERAHDIILCRPNREKKWLVNYYYSRRCFHNLPLYTFVRENKLCKGDICVFELMKGKRRVTMIVHVIRKANDQFILIG